MKAMILLILLIATSCACTDKSESTVMILSRLAQQDTARWSLFLECSKDQGDAGCDSCFTAIYGFSLEAIHELERKGK